MEPTKDIWTWEIRGGRKLQGILGTESGLLHRACEEKIGDKAKRALTLTLRSPETLAQSGHCSEGLLLSSDTWGNLGRAGDGGQGFVSQRVQWRGRT